MTVVAKSLSKKSKCRIVTFVQSKERGKGMMNERRSKGKMLFFFFGLV